MIIFLKTYKNHLLIIFLLGLVIWSYIIAITLSYNFTEMADRKIDTQFFYLKMNLTLIFLAIIRLTTRYWKQLQRPQQ